MVDEQPLSGILYFFALLFFLSAWSCVLLSGRRRNLHVCDPRDRFRHTRRGFRVARVCPVNSLLAACRYVRACYEELGCARSCLHGDPGLLTRNTL